MDLMIPKDDLQWGKDFVFFSLYAANHIFGLGNDIATISLEEIAVNYYGGDFGKAKAASKCFRKEKECKTINNRLFNVERRHIEVKGSFILVHRSDFYKVFNSNYAWSRKLGIMYHLCCLIASMNYGESSMIDGKRGVYGYMSNAFFSKAEKVAPNTIMKYNNLLEELGIIVRIKKRWGVKENKLLPSIYALKENEDLLKKCNHTEEKNEIEALFD